MKFLYRVLVFLIGFLVQWWWSAHFTFYGLSPQVLLVLTVAVAWTIGPVGGQVFGLGWGLCLDALAPHLFGANTLALSAMGYVVGNARRQMDASSPASQMILVMVLSYLYVLFLALTGLIFKGQSFWPGWLVFVLIPLINGIVSPFGFAIIRQYIRP